tara:strand:- start:4254 stop:4424 length:171 start_codon:yes stop_codon:yes gene_type:complete
MSYKEWIQSVERKKRNDTSLIFRFSFYFWLLALTAFKGFLYAFGGWVFIKLIGITL